MFDDSSDYTGGNASNPIMVGGDSSLQLSGASKKKNKWQSFLGGMQPQGGQGGGVLGGLSSLAGSGGLAGGIGNIAKFLL